MSPKSWFLSKGEKLIVKAVSFFIGPPASACSLLITEEGKIVGIDAGDFYTLPGGIVDTGESFEQAAVREAREETGLSIQVLKRIKENVREGLGLEVVFLSIVTGGELEGSREGEPEIMSVSGALQKEWRHDRDIKSLIREAVEEGKLEIDDRALEMRFQ